MSLDRLFTFPTELKNSTERKKWIQAFNRADEKKTHLLKEPKKCHRVCSDHFKDGEPTVENPTPTLKLGTKKNRSSGTPRPGPDKRRRVEVTSSPNETNVPEPQIADNLHVNDASSNDTAPSASSNQQLEEDVLNQLQERIKQLELENARLRKQSQNDKARMAKLNKTKVSHVNLLTTDGDVRYYTGVPNKETFYAIHESVAKYVRKRWKGKSSLSTKVKRKFTKSPRKFGPQRMLCSEDEMLLTLIRLRLGLLRKDLADRFAISQSLVSQIFHSWLTALSKVLGKLIWWAPKENVAMSKPSRFNKLPQIRSIIDATEFHIETPKDPKIQACCYSSYKHHHTAKVIVCCAPNSTITFLSKVYGGRASDKACLMESGLLDMHDPHDMTQTDKGFGIENECAERMLYLSIPPGLRGAAQMTSENVKRTSEVANLRILIEQVIRRIKTFRMLKNEIPITLLPHLEKMVIVCAAITNLWQPIYKD